MKNNKIICMGLAGSLLLSCTAFAAPNLTGTQKIKQNVIMTTKASNAIGTTNFTGTLKSIEKTNNTIFIVVAGANEERAFYCGTNMEGAASAQGFVTGDKVNVNYVLGTPIAYKDTKAMPFSAVKASDTANTGAPGATPKMLGSSAPMLGSTKIGSTKVIAPNPNAKTIGINKATGIVRAVEKAQDNVYLTIITSDKTLVYYISASNVKAASLSQLKFGDSVEATYALGTPVKYNKTMAMPLSDVKVIKTLAEELNK